MNKKELRDKFFKEHTYKCEIPIVCTHPHNLFEWMYEQLQLYSISNQRELLIAFCNWEKVGFEYNDTIQNNVDKFLNEKGNL